ncbi:MULTISPECIES: TIGR01906 family membrane protein [Helcococcus]|uniref:TIGR01906 family membrane protein n=2 Tax=Helcococcus TaxID=31983 RepID=A0ABW9F6J2_9FIRM
MSIFCKKYAKLITVLFSFSLILFLLTLSINIGSEDFNFYKNFSIEHNLKNQVGVSQDNLEKMYKSLQGQIKNGDEKEIKQYFNDREVSHMKDVYKLFNLNRNINRIMMVIVIISSTLVYYNKEDKVQNSKYIINYLLIILVGFLILGGIVYYNFESSFIKFHELFFNNDLWLLNPETDIMIRMLPQEFFMSIAFKIFRTFIFNMGIIIISLTIYIFVKKRGKKNVSVQWK